MNFDLGPELTEFRLEVRAFLEDFGDIGAFFHHEDDYDVATRRLYLALGERNWLALAWPGEVGGEGKHPLFEFVLWDEMARSRAAPPAAGLGNRGQDDHPGRNR